MILMSLAILMLVFAIGTENRRARSIFLALALVIAAYEIAAFFLDSLPMQPIVEYIREDASSVEL